MPKYLSGRVKRTPQNKLTDDRYQYLDIGQAEPNIGDPPTASGTPGIPAGQQYQLVSVLSHPGERYWIPIGGGLIPGAISIYEEGSLVSGVSSITQLNFVGNSLTADAAPYVAGLSAGNIATITAAPPGSNTSVLFKESGDFATSTDLVFNTAVGILTVGNGINIGIGGTIISAKTSSSTGYPLVGINEANPTQELDVNGDIRIRGTIYDINNEPGDQGELLLKGLNGLEWTNQNAITAGAGGDIGQVQYHNTAGLVDGADIFYYDAVNDRVGIGSTQPAQVLDVLGVSTFIGGVTVDHLYVTGITTALNLINADGGIKANTAQVTDLTEDRVVYVGPNGELVDSSNLTFDDYTFGASGINVSGCTTTSQLEATGVSTLGNIQLDTNTIDTKSGNLILNSAGGTVQVNAKIFLNNVTQSTTKSTGALTISGGLGIIKDVNVGGAVSFKGNSDPTGVAVTLAAAGGITTTGGDLYVGGDLFIKDDTVFSDGKFEQLLVNPGIATFRGDVEFWSNADSDKIAYWDKSEDSLRFNDDARIKLGNSDDLQLYHSSNINYIINEISDGELRIVNGVGPANIAKFINACSVDLYYDSANFPLPKLQTSGIGVTVTGQLDAATANLSSTLTVGGASNLNGDVNLGNALTDDIVFGGKVDSHILPNINETYDLGSGSNRWDTVYARTFDGLGTLTVEDLYVTGIATFKDDVEFHGTGGVDSKGNVGIKSAFWDKSEMRFRYLDNIEASWGDTRELQIYHFDDSYIKNTSATGNLYVDSTNEFYIRTEGGLENAIKAKTNEGVDLYYDGGLRLSTYDKGIKLSANGTVGAAVSIYDGNNSNYAAIKSPNTLTADYTLTLPPDDGGPDNILKTDGNGILSWIAQGDLTAKPGGENTEVQYNDNGSFDGMESLLYSKTIGDITFVGDTKQAIWNKSDDSLEFQDSAKARFGTDDDLEIYHNSSTSTSHIEDTAGNTLLISGKSGAGSHKIQINAESGKPSIIATANAEVSLYYNNGKRLETTTDGIRIYGGLRDKDGDLGTAGYILKSTGTELDWINPSTIGAEPGGSDTQVQYNNDGSFGGMVNLTYIDSGTNSGNINILNSLGATKVQWKATDDYGGANGLIEFKDDVKLRFGSNSQNIEIYHQQSGNANYFDNNVKLNFRIKDELNIQTTSSANVIKAVEGGSVTLYYNSFDKLATTTDGIKITGGIRDKDDQLGSSGQILSSTGSQLDWINASSIVGAAGGDDTEIQFNNNGNLDGADYFKYTYNGASAGDVTFVGLSADVYWSRLNSSMIMKNGSTFTFGQIGSTNNFSTRIYGTANGNGYWDASQGAGNVYIKGSSLNPDSATHKVYIQPNEFKESIIATANAEVSLWHNNTKRLETTSDAIRIYGGIRDKDGQIGDAGQILSSTGTELDWIDQTTGPVGQADQVKTTRNSNNATHYLTFVDSNNNPGAYESVYTGDGIKFNPNTSDLSVDGRLYLNGVGNNAAGSIWTKGGQDKKFFIYNDSTEGEIGFVVANSSNDLSVGIVTFKRTNAYGDKSYFRSDVSVPVNESYNLGDSITQRWDNVYAKTYHGEVLKLYDSDKTHKITLQTPATADLTADYTLTLPQNDGATNEVLTTDGNGILSWTAKGSGGTGGLTNILVDYTGRSAPCDMPITISTPSSGTKQINIPDSSNAFGAKYVQTSEPTGSSVCDGDVWYDTTPPASSGDVGGNVPVGGIIMYSGTDTELNALTNWKLCDGTTYGSVTTPNLKDKFVIGADQYSSGWKTNVTGSLTPDGGSKDAVVVQHNHTYVTKGGAYTGDSHTEQSNTWRLESTVNTGDSGESGTNKNLPPYYALAYIMRIS